MIEAGSTLPVPQDSKNRTAMPAASETHISANDPFKQD